MQPNTDGYRPGSATLLGFVLGTFIGLLFGNLALGMIFGFFIGARSFHSWPLVALEAVSSVLMMLGIDTGTSTSRSIDTCQTFGKGPIFNFAVSPGSTGYPRRESNARPAD